MSRASWVVRFLMTLAATSGAAMLPVMSQTVDAKIHDVGDVMRALQTGVPLDLSKIPAKADLKKMLRTERVSGRRGQSLSEIPFQPKVVGGISVPNFDSVVKIEFKTTDGQDDLCSGFLFNAEIVDAVQVLTAAHCSCGQPNSYRIFHDRPGGDSKLPYVLASLPSRYRDYSCELPPESQVGRDLAIFWVKTEGKTIDETNITLSFPMIASMHQVYRDTATRRLVGVGYGRTESGQLAPVAVAAAVPIQSFFCAGGAFAASACASFREFVLADTSAGPGVNRPDSCGGDSGAPIFWVPPLPASGVLNPADVESGPRFLVGITSRALDGVRHNPGTTCGGGGIYTAVGHPDVIRWLTANGVTVQTDFK